MLLGQLDILKPAQQPLVSGPSTFQTQVASSAVPTIQTLQPPQQASQTGPSKHPTQYDERYVSAH